MEKKPNIELAVDFMEEVWVQGNEDAIFREFDGVATGIWPDETGVDPHGFLQYHRALKPLVKDMTFEWLKWHEHGDHLWANWIVWGKHWKDSDKIIRWPGAATARYREGRMVECNNHHDFHHLFSQLGLVAEQAFEVGLAGKEIIEAEEHRKEAMAPSERGRTHFLWPGLRKVVTGGRELYLPCSPRQVLSVDSGQQFLLPDEEQLEILFESTAFAMAVVDEDNLILEADAAFSDLLDRIPESLPGVAFHQLVLPEDRSREAVLFAELTQGKRAYYRHRVRLMRGRTILWVQLSVARIPLEEGGHRIVRAVQESSRIEELVEFQETERKMLSVELHDGLAQELATLWIYLHTGKQKAEPTPGLIERCLSVVERMSQELRTRMQELRSPILEGVLLTEALERLTQRASRDHGIQVVLQLQEELDQAEHTVSLIVYRVVQEAMRNVVNHSGARRCLVHLKRVADKVEGSIADDGSGFDIDAAAAKGRLGMRGMKDRCELVGGQLDVLSRPGNGTEIRFVLPWAPENS